MLVSSIFFSFPHFLPFPNQISVFGILFILSSANAFDLDKSKILSFGKESKCTLTLYHTILTFNESFKNIVEKGENAGKDHFLIFQCFSILSKLHLIRCLQMLSVWSCPKICRLEKAYSTWLHGKVSKYILTYYQMTNFWLFQTERVRRRQFEVWRKWQKVIQTGRKHCGKRRNCSLRAISPFPTVFSRGMCPRGIQRCHCVGMG